MEIKLEVRKWGDLRFDNFFKKVVKSHVYTYIYVCEVVSTVNNTPLSILVIKALKTHLLKLKMF
jgi:hypothetical protein